MNVVLTLISHISKKKRDEWKNVCLRFMSLLACMHMKVCAYFIALVYTLPRAPNTTLSARLTKDD